MRNSDGKGHRKINFENLDESGLKRDLTQRVESSGDVVLPHIHGLLKGFFPHGFSSVLQEGDYNMIRQAIARGDVEPQYFAGEINGEPVFGEVEVVEANSPYKNQEKRLAVKASVTTGKGRFSLMNFLGRTKGDKVVYKKGQLVSLETSEVNNVVPEVVGFTSSGVAIRATGDKDLGLAIGETPEDLTLFNGQSALQQLNGQTRVVGARETRAWKYGFNGSGKAIPTGYSGLPELAEDMVEVVETLESAKSSVRRMKGVKEVKSHEIDVTHRNKLSKPIDY